MGKFSHCSIKNKRIQQTLLDVDKNRANQVIKCKITGCPEWETFASCKQKGESNSRNLSEDTENNERLWYKFTKRKIFKVLYVLYKKLFCLRIISV